MPTVSTNDVDTYYEERGDGPPVVFVHGMFMNTTEWAPQMAALAGSYRTVAYDVRGHGRTGGSDRESYDMALYASDLDALLTALDVERAVLCGLSMGGCIAQVYAATHPERVAGVVLADTFTAEPLPPGGRLLFGNLRVLGRLDRFVRYTTLNRLQLWVGNRLSRGIAGDPETIQRVVEAGPTIPHGEVVKIADSVAGFPGSGFDSARVTAPALVLHGENVPGMMRVMHERLVLALPGADGTVTVVPDAGHASNLDNPAFFTDALRGFLSEVLPAAPGPDEGGAAA